MPPSPSPDGRIPFVLRVGVTGHRTLDDPARLDERVREALARVVSFVPTGDTPLRFRAISSLAEGADRLVAQAVLAADGGTLEVPLPMEPDQYRRDFTGEDSHREFDELLARAVQVDTAPAHDTAEEAFERVGRYMVERSDVVLAIWDGEPARGQGGTAEIVGYALDRQVPVVLIPADGGALSEDLGDGAPSGAFAGCGVTRDEPSGLLPLAATRLAYENLDRYNRSRGLRRHDFRQAVTDEAGSLPLTDRTFGSELQTLAGSILPYFVRADRLAVSYQFWFHTLALIGFLSAACAVLTIATVTLFAGSHDAYAGLELLFLAAIPAVYWLARHLRLHERWLSTRFLAERLRAVIFLKATGLAHRYGGGFEGVNFAHPEEDWLRRAYAYVWDSCPTVDVAAPEVQSLRRFLVDWWIEPQMRWHQRAGQRRRRSYRLATWASIGLFVVTAVVALLHALSVLPHQSHYLELAGIALPAFGSALAAIGAHHQYQRNAAVYSRMSGNLKAAMTRMGQARTVGEIQATAASVDDIIGEENRDWVGVMKFNDFEIAG